MNDEPALKIDPRDEETLDDHYKALNAAIVARADPVVIKEAERAYIRQVESMFPRVLPGYIVAAVKPQQVFSGVAMVAFHTQKHGIRFPTGSAGTYVRQIATPSGIRVLRGEHKLHPGEADGERSHLAWDMLERWRHVTVPQLPPAPVMPIPANQRIPRPVEAPSALYPHEPISTSRYFFQKVTVFRTEAGTGLLPYGHPGTVPLYLEKT